MIVSAPEQAVNAAEVDVVGVGNAIVDVIAQASDEFVAEQGLAKGSMTLIDADRAHALYDSMGPGIEASGGSAANTVAGVASFGGTASYIGKVSADELGDVFGHDMRASGVNFDMVPATNGPATARCLILVTPDAQRTMNTYLGISSLLEPGDVVEAIAASGHLLFCEGYLWDVESAKQAIRKAMAIARDAGRQVSLTLSDSFCVERHFDEFRELVAGPVDVLFANEAELRTLYRTAEGEAGLRDGVAAVGRDVELAFVTLGGRGSLVVQGNDVIEIAPVVPPQLVDTTGAGDQYAAGALFGLARGLDLAECGRLGSLAASEVISHVGPRPFASLRALAGLG